MQTTHGFVRVAAMLAQKNAYDGKMQEGVQTLLKEVTSQVADTRVQQPFVAGKVSEVEKITEKLPELLKSTNPVVVPLTFNDEQPSVAGNSGNIPAAEEKEKERSNAKIPPVGGFLVESHGGSGFYGPFFGKAEEGQRPPHPTGRLRQSEGGGAAPMFIPFLGELVHQELPKNLKRPYFDENISGMWADIEVERDEFWNQITSGLERTDAEKLHVFEGCLAPRLSEQKKSKRREGVMVTFTTAFAFWKERFAPLQSLNARRVWQAITL